MEKENEFELDYLFSPEKDAIKALREFGDILEALSDFDSTLIKQANPNSRTIYAFTSIEYSSIRTTIAQLIRSTPDDAIKELNWKKFVGHYLLKGKYALLKFLEKNNNIQTKEEFLKLNNELQTEYAKLPQTPFSERTLNPFFVLNSLEQVTIHINKLNKNEVIEYKSKFGNARVSKGIHLNMGNIIRELGAAVVDNTTTEILKVKKIDLLSDEAKWEFKRGTKSLTAKITDADWLFDFHNRGVIIQPEDSMKVILRSSYVFTDNNEYANLHYEIEKVIGIIKPKKSDQSALPW